MSKIGTIEEADMDKFKCRIRYCDIKEFVGEVLQFCEIHQIDEVPTISEERLEELICWWFDFE